MYKIENGILYKNGKKFLHWVSRIIRRFIRASFRYRLTVTEWVK